MRFFAGYLFTFLLLLSNGMVISAIDLCCNHPDATHLMGSDAAHASSKKQSNSCCSTNNKQDTNQSQPITCEEASHENCDFDYWYFFTPKYQEQQQSYQWKPIVHHVYGNANLGFRLIPLDTPHSKCCYSWIKDPPAYKISLEIIEYHCSWLI